MTYSKTSSSFFITYVIYHSYCTRCLYSSRFTLTKIKHVTKTLRFSLVWKPRVNLISAYSSKLPLLRGLFHKYRSTNITIRAPFKKILIHTSALSLTTPLLSKYNTVQILRIDNLHFIRLIFLCVFSCSSDLIVLNCVHLMSPG